MESRCTASAPGKLLVAGEYAVLRGHAALLVAIDRRATAWLSDKPAAQSPFLRAVHAEVVRQFGAEHRAALAAARIAVTTDGFHTAAGKLGLGSSAATTTAATTLALGAAGITDRTAIAALAHRAHRAAQSTMGAPGSGADVAICAYGGCALVRCGQQATGDHDDPGSPPCEVTPCSWPEAIPWTAIYTGHGANTARLVAKVETLKETVRAPIEAQLAEAAQHLTRALQSARGDDAVAAIEAGARAIAALGSATDLPLLTPAHRQTQELAHRFGGAAKPTGAGGGDTAFAVFSDPLGKQRFLAALGATDLTPVPLTMTARGAEFVG